MPENTHPDISWRKRAPSEKMLEAILLYDRGLRHCRSCDKVKSITCFSRQVQCQFGISRKCKDCVKKNHSKAERSYFYNRSKEKNKKVNAAWRAENKEKIREGRRRLDREKRKTPEGLLTARLKCAIRDCIRRGDVKSRTLAVIGYTPAELKRHLEAQFLKGMSWENASLWHIDHIVPLSAFDFKGGGIDEIKRAWAITNLRPLWAKDNISKHNKRIFLV